MPKTLPQSYHDTFETHERGAYTLPIDFSTSQYQEDFKLVFEKFMDHFYYELENYRDNHFWETTKEGAIDRKIKQLVPNYDKNNYNTASEKLKMPSHLLAAFSSIVENSFRYANEKCADIFLGQSMKRALLTNEPDMEVDENTEHQSTMETGDTTITTQDTQITPIHQEESASRDPPSHKEQQTSKPTPKKKSNKKASSTSSPKVITGYVPENQDRVRDILLYDIPVSWTAEKILAELTSLGQTMTMSCKVQKKYQTVRVKIALSSFAAPRFDRGEWMVILGDIPVRWYPATWTLRERKKRDAFQLEITDLPGSVTTDALINSPLNRLLTQGKVKQWKIIITGKMRNLILYYESWADLSLHKGTEFDWNGVKLKVSAHIPPSFRNKKKMNKPTEERRRTSPNTSNVKESKAISKYPNSRLPNRNGRNSNQKESILADISVLLRKLVGLK